MRIPPKSQLEMGASRSGEPGAKGGIKPWASQPEKIAGGQKRVRLSGSEKRARAKSRGWPAASRRPLCRAQPSRKRSLSEYSRLAAFPAASRPGGGPPDLSPRPSWRLSKRPPGMARLGARSAAARPRGRRGRGALAPAPLLAGSHGLKQRGGRAPSAPCPPFASHGRFPWPILMGENPASRARGPRQK
jgi:hypothetical protein